MIAYDLETTRIKVGTPRPLYITAYTEEFGGFQYESRIRSLPHLRLILVNHFLTPEFAGAKFVAWNGNNFDGYFIAAAMLTDPEFIIRPYLTRSNSLRGLRITYIHDDKLSWEFVDGIAMLGLVQTPLSAFLDKFAPNYRKLKEAIDFEREEFDYRNVSHCEYAMRDSVGLYHGMVHAQQILMDRFNQPLAVTMGGACIRIFKANIPHFANSQLRLEPRFREQLVIYKPNDACLAIIRDYVMRGGFCFCVKRFHGKVWKYDINQAYAAAMREANLPCGNAAHGSGRLHPFAEVFIARVTARNAANRVPFYYRSESRGKMRSLFAETEVHDTWITSIEYRQLEREGWEIKCHEYYLWEDSFSMTDYVNSLEAGRMAADGGPNGPIGTMFKNVGNHSYGKTVEQLDPVEFVLAGQSPGNDWAPYYGDNDSEPLRNVYYRFMTDMRNKDYHQPQIGAFITAHVRMVVRRAALLAPDAWLYADTDCVVFSRDVTSKLDIDTKRYGAWKVEESGAVYKIIAKKVYAEIADPLDAEKERAKLKRSAKGLHVKKLTEADFDAWYEGAAPSQAQTQRQNFLSVMRGAEMYRLQERSGTNVQ